MSAPIFATASIIRIPAQISICNNMLQRVTIYSCRRHYINAQPVPAAANRRFEL